LRWPLTPSNAEVEERVKLYICSPSGSSWPVLGWTLLRLSSKTCNNFVSNRTGGLVSWQIPR